MTVLEQLLKKFKENTTNFFTSDSGLHSNQRLQNKDDELLPDPDIKGLNVVNKGEVNKGSDANEKDFDKEVKNSVAGKD